MSIHTRPRWFQYGNIFNNNCFAFYARTSFMKQKERAFIVQMMRIIRSEAFLYLSSAFAGEFLNFLPPFFLLVPGLFGSDFLHSWGDCWVASQPTGKTTRVSQDKFPAFCADYGGVKTEQMLFHPPHCGYTLAPHQYCRREV